MTLFDDRERAYEAKFVHDLELRFRARISAMRMVAAWAAGRMALIGGPAHDYEQGVIARFVQHPDDEALIGRIAGDLADVGEHMDAAVLRAMFEGFLARTTIEMTAPAAEDRPKRHRPAAH